MAERKLSLIILGKATSALAAMKSTGDAAQSLGKRVTDMLPSFKTVAIAGAAAFGAVGAAALGAVQAAAQDEQSQKKLADQLRRTTDATAEQIAAVEQHISKQMMLTGVTDDQLRPAMANLVRATGDVSFAQDQLGLALDISAATGKDLESVSLALGKAFTGNVGALTKLGVPLEQSVVKSKNLSEVIKTLNEQFGGAAAGAADTFSGRLRILQTSLGEAVEGIGYALLPIAERLVAFIQSKVVPVIQAFSDTLAGGGGLRNALLAAGAQMGEFGMKALNVIEKVALAMIMLGKVTVDVIQPLLFPLRELAGGLTLITTRSMDSANAVEAGFTGIIELNDKLGATTDDVGVAFANFRTDLLGVAAASTVTQEQLRALEQQQRQAASGGTAVVQGFIGPLLQGYGALAPKTKTAEELNAEFLATLAKLQAGAGGAGGKVKEVGDAMKKYTDSLIAARNATRSQADASEAVGKAQLSLNAKTTAVTDAQEKFNTVVRGFPANAQQSIDAARRFADAQRGVRDSGLQVADAVRNVADAEKALADLRSRAADAEKVGGAERALERSKYGVEEANFRVTDAEKALADLRLDPDASPIAIRRAEIDLAEAKLSVSDAVQSVADAERRLAAERNVAPTADEIAEAERNLERAKYAVTDALDAQTRATEEQSSAQAHLNEITNGATVGSDAYNAALKDLQEAKRDQMEASESLADAMTRERDAMYDLAEATKVLLAVQGKTKAGVVARAQGGLGVAVDAAGRAVENIGDVSANMAGGVVAGGTTVNLNVQAGMFTSPVEVGNEIIDALRAWERSNGSIALAL